MKKENINLGRWTEEKLDGLLRKVSAISGTGERIQYLSEQFLGITYNESTLIGDAGTAEVFVINLEAVDCFTFLDYVESMRSSDSFASFKENLRMIRYRSDKVSFESRNHFFTDWLEFNASRVEDITGRTGNERAILTMKALNDKGDGTVFLPGIPCREREIAHIPSHAVDDVVVERLKTGDYIGIYSELPGLDVSHAGIIVKESGKVKFRHASSSQRNRKVVDEDFKKYIAGKPGIVVLRPL